MIPTRLSAGVVIFRQAQGCWQCLLLRAFNNWDFPKGMLEPGEQPFDAARREVREETALTRLAFPWGEEFRETPPYGRGKVARYYLAVWEEGSVHLPVNPSLGRPEHHAFRWVDCATATTMLPERLHPVLEWACARIRAVEGSRL